jgi:hypothetical protein
LGAIFEAPVRHIVLHDGNPPLRSDDGPSTKVEADDHTAAHQGAFIFLHSHLNEGELECGAMAQAARLFLVSHKIWVSFVLYSLPTMVTAQMMRAKSYSMSPWHTKSMIKPRSRISGFL